jgi:hypothetical protein
MQMDNDTQLAKFERLRLRTIFAGLAIAGVVLNIVSDYISHYILEWFDLTLKELGTALIVSAVLGATVDIFLKGELARDAFVAAFRYVLPAQFKEEVSKILTHPFISKDHTWKVKIAKIDETVTVVTTTVERKIENRTSSDHERGALYIIPEYDYENFTAEILECAIEMNGEKHSRFSLQCYTNEIKATSDSKFKIAPGESAKISVKAKQYRRINDSVMETFIDPIINPVIEVESDNTLFEHKIEFGTKGHYERSEFYNKYSLDAVYFPGQYMYVRWWPKKDHPKLPEAAMPISS